MTSLELADLISDCEGQLGEIDIEISQTKLKRLHKFAKGVVNFHQRKDQMITFIQIARDKELPITERFKIFSKYFEDLLYELHRCDSDNSELDDETYQIVSDAIVLSWELCPDVTIGLQMLLDNFSEGPNENILLISKDIKLLSTIKSIATLKTSFSNSSCLGIFIRTAKTILSRVQSPGQSFLEGTVSGPLASLSNLASKLRDSTVSKSFPKTGSQPSRKRTESSQDDQRRCCDRPECMAIESGNKKFGKCGKCRKVAYCSKECQSLHWAMHKKKCS